MQTASRSDGDASVDRYVRAWLDGASDAGELVGALTGSAADDAAFWTGAAHLEAGDPAAAAASLRRWLVGVDDAEADREITAYARTLLVYAETGPVEAMRQLVVERGDDWPRWCPLALDRAVFDVADHDPQLLVLLLRGGVDVGCLDPATRTHAGRRMLELALAAPHSGLVASRLKLAERLLGPDPAAS